MAIFLVSFKESFYLCHRKNSRIDWIGKLINFYEIPRQASLLNGGQWRATPFGVTFESVDYKEDEHSNHVIRSFITSSMRLSIYKKEDGSSTVKNRPLFDLVYDRAITR